MYNNREKNVARFLDPESYKGWNVLKKLPRNVYSIVNPRFFARNHFKKGGDDAVEMTSSGTIMH